MLRRATAQCYGSGDRRGGGRAGSKLLNTWGIHMVPSINLTRSTGLGATSSRLCPPVRRTALTFDVPLSPVGTWPIHGRTRRGGGGVGGQQTCQSLASGGPGHTTRLRPLLLNRDRESRGGGGGRPATGRSRAQTRARTVPAAFVAQRCTRRWQRRAAPPRR